MEGVTWFVSGPRLVLLTSFLSDQGVKVKEAQAVPGQGFPLTLMWQKGPKTPSWSGGARAHDRDGAVGPVQHGVAHGAEDQAREATTPAGADDDQGRLL